MRQCRSMAADGRGRSLLPRLEVTADRCVGIAVVLLSLCRLAVGAEAPVPSSTAGSGPANDSTTRYRFIERYSLTEDGDRPEVITQYRVAIRETIKTSIDSPQGTPQRNETTLQTISSERPAQVSGTGVVTAVVRRYETFRITPVSSAAPTGGRLLEGLTLWYRPRAGQAPQILSLTENSTLRDVEYNVAARQVYLPDLTAVLPALPSRIGERWKLPLTAVQAMLGERPTRGVPLTATLQEVKAGLKGPLLVAVIGVAGRVSLQGGETLVNARIQFAFSPPTAADSGPDRARGEAGTVDARGSITGMRLALSTTVGLAAPDDRLQRTHTRELVLERQRGTGGPPLAVPESPPTATEENSWLTYDDPKGRFHFRHPQDFRPAPRSGTDSIDLVQFHPEGLGVVTVQMQPRGNDPTVERQNLDPETHRARLNAEWAGQRLDVKRGPMGWLPEADWAQSGLKVYRIEAVLKPLGDAAAGGQPRYFDYYLVLSRRAESLIVTAMTVQDPSLRFRDQVEAQLKTYKLGPAPGR